MNGLLSGVLPAVFQAGNRGKKMVNALLDRDTWRQAMDYSNFQHPTQQELIDSLPMGVLGTVSKPVANALLRKVAPYEEAHRIAQRNAAKPVSEGGLGLPPNNTAADRAKAMGFQGGIFHGGVNDFPAFKVSDRSNVYATDVPGIADIYANATGRHKGLREINAAPNVVPLMYRGRLLEVSDQGPTGGGWLTDNLAAAIGEEPRRNLFKALPSKGYSGAKVVEIDDLGGRQSQYVFPDPSVLRSPYAAFDPARINENNLLGYARPSLLGLLGLGSLGTAAYLNQNK